MNNGRKGHSKTIHVDRTEGRRPRRDCSGEHAWNVRRTPGRHYQLPPARPFLSASASASRRRRAAPRRGDGEPCKRLRQNSMPCRGGSRRAGGPANTRAPTGYRSGDRLPAWRANPRSETVQPALYRAPGELLAVDRHRSSCVRSRSRQNSPLQAEIGGNSSTRFSLANGQPTHSREQVPRPPVPQLTGEDSEPGRPVDR